jgi:hypothetical protein
MNRKDYLHKMLLMANPVLDAAAKGELRKTMIIEQKPGANRENYAGLEAIGRLLCGMAPWFEAKITDLEECRLRDDLLHKARLAIEGQVNSDSDDFTDYKTYGGPFSQILVDTALLAQAILRAPIALWEPLSQDTKENVIALLKAARTFTPVCNNWILFSTEVEILYQKVTGIRDQRGREIISKYFQLMDSWYCGDGWYGDGPEFKFDYYNSLIIYPMLLDFCDNASDLLKEGANENVLRRAQRHAEILENLVSPDGTYIATGRSLSYRCGVFHLLAQLTWQDRLPSTISPATSREILYAVTEKTLGPNSFREDGFLNIGICNRNQSMVKAIFAPAACT